MRDPDDKVANQCRPAWGATCWTATLILTCMSCSKRCVRLEQRGGATVERTSGHTRSAPSAAASSACMHSAKTKAGALWTAPASSGWQQSSRMRSTCASLCRAVLAVMQDLCRPRSIAMHSQAKAAASRCPHTWLSLRHLPRAHVYPAANPALCVLQGATTRARFTCPPWPGPSRRSASPRSRGRQRRAYLTSASIGGPEQRRSGPRVRDTSNMLLQLRRWMRRTLNLTLRDAGQRRQNHSSRRNFLWCSWGWRTRHAHLPVFFRKLGSGSRAQGSDLLLS